MIKREVTVHCTDGLEARPIAMLVQTASRYASRVYIEVGTKKINAKSIMGMMSLNVYNGDKVIVVTDGEDENAAADEIEAYLTKQ